MGEFTRDIKILNTPQQVQRQRALELQEEIDRTEEGCDSFISKTQDELIEDVAKSDGFSAIYVYKAFHNNLSGLPHAVSHGAKKMVKRWMRLYGYITLPNGYAIPVQNGFFGKIKTALHWYAIMFRENSTGPWTLLVTLTTMITVLVIVSSIL